MSDPQLKCPDSGRLCVLGCKSKDDCRGPAVLSERVESRAAGDQREMGCNDKSQPLNCDRDPARWAREFNQVMAETECRKLDEGLLIAWFANAMMCGEDTYRWKLEAQNRHSGDVDVARHRLGLIKDSLQEAQKAAMHMMAVTQGESYAFWQLRYNEATAALGALESLPSATAPKLPLLQSLKYELQRMAFGAPVDKPRIVALIDRINEALVAPEAARGEK